MRLEVPIDRVRFRASTEDQAASGYLGCVAFDYGRMRIDGIALRRTDYGVLHLSYPRRRGGAVSGKYLKVARPLDNAEKNRISKIVLRAVREILQDQ